MHFSPTNRPFLRRQHLSHLLVPRHHRWQVRKPAVLSSRSSKTQGLLRLLSARWQPTDRAEHQNHKHTTHYHPTTHTISLLPNRSKNAPQPPIPEPLTNLPAPESQQGHPQLTALQPLTQPHCSPFTARTPHTPWHTTTYQCQNKTSPSTISKPLPSTPQDSPRLITPSPLTRRDSQHPVHQHFNVQ